MAHTPSVSKSDQIVTIAARLLSDAGLDQFVMRRIAEQAGMKLGNLQYYFPTRNDLLEAVVRAEFAEDLATIGAVEHNDPQQRLSGFVEALSNRWFDRNGSVYLPIAVLALHEERFEQVISEIYSDFHKLTADIVTAIDSSATPAIALQRAILMTSLLDGASLQPIRHTKRSRAALISELTQLATSIAAGHPHPSR